MEIQRKNLHLVESVVWVHRLGSVCGVLWNLKDLIHRKVHGRGPVRGRIEEDPLASQALSDGGSQMAVILHRFLSESEETEEEEGGKNGGPLCDLKPKDSNRILVPHDSGDLVNVGVFPVGVIPGDPRVNLARPGVQDNNASGHRDGETKINGSQSNETPVMAVCKVAVGGDKILELLPSL
jgi:hypothetical protein